jgi:hypothetical protein
MPNPSTIENICESPSPDLPGNFLISLGGANNKASG